MSFTSSIDVFSSPELEQGGSLLVSGWIADVLRGATASSVVAIVDGTHTYKVDCLTRPDVAKHFGNHELANAGFHLWLSTKDLAIGGHTFALVAEDSDGAVHRITERSFRILPPGTLPRFPRVLVAGAPKSASTHTWLVLTRYFQTDELTPAETLRGIEPNLDEWLLERLRGRAYVISVHMMPYAWNMRAMTEEGITPIVTWRNLADTVVSIDDHIHKHDDREGWSTSYVDRTPYLAMGEQGRYQYLIRYALPWYVGFFLSWKKTGAPIVGYEEMVADPMAHFGRIIKGIAGSVNEPRLLAALDAAGMAAEHGNRNVGVVGRSLECFSSETKALLEEFLSAPHFESLEELRAELPWNTARS